MKLVYCSRIFLIGLTLLLSNLSYSQQHVAAGYRQAADITGILAETETVPLDNAVLDVAPSQLSLVFPHPVRLVKLTLRNEQRDWVDISFRYNPLANDNFVWELPNLQTAIYYTADWAILAANERLVRGSFSFAFGPDAELPSIAKEAEAMLMDMGHGDPSTRYVMPPRTQIIIDRDPPRFDPPFTIELKPEDRQNN